MLNKSLPEIVYTLPCSMNQDPPASCSLQMGRIVSAIKRTSVWHNFLYINEKMLTTSKRSLACGDSGEVCFTILHAERTGVI